MNEQMKKAAKKAWIDIAKETWWAWKLAFLMQLVIGSHVLYERAAEYPDMGFWYYTLVLLFVSAIAATLLVFIVSVLLILIGSIIVAFMLWREGKKRTA